jgi:hypothetical protein
MSTKSLGKPKRKPLKMSKPRLKPSEPRLKPSPGHKRAKKLPDGSYDV